MPSRQIIDRLANWLDWGWTGTALGLMLISIAVCGCESSVTAPQPAKPVATNSGDYVPPPVAPLPPDGAVPGEHIRTNGGAAVDVNPPGGGVHVNVPPSGVGEGVHVDVGPGGVNVTPPNPAPAP